MKEKKMILSFRQISYLHHVCDLIIKDKLPPHNRSVVTKIRDIIDKGWYGKWQERDFLISIRNDYIKELYRYDRI